MLCNNSSKGDLLSQSFNLLHKCKCQSNDLESGFGFCVEAIRLQRRLIKSSFNFSSTNVRHSNNQFFHRTKKYKKKNMMHCSERRMIIWSLCIILCLSNSVLVIASSFVQHLCLPDQRDALWKIKNEFSVDKPEWLKSITMGTEHWMNNTDCCYWVGVICGIETGNVIELELTASYLSGRLRSNSSLFKLQHLEVLFLGDNNLGGILPDSIGNLRHLRALDLHGCNLFGKIPSSLGNLSYLDYVHLSDNDFTGELPTSMGYLKRLTELQIKSNKLSGDFSHLLLNLSSLTWIDLRNNQLKGMLPSNMSSLSKLERFDISENSFSGTIPSSLFMIPSLFGLSLRSNDFSGPLEIGNSSSQSKLRWFLIGENNFSGIVDLSFFSHLKLLEGLDLSGINLKNISSTLPLPSSIESLILSSCNISEFPKFLRNQTSLYYLDISSNQIEGQVPEWFWRLPQLRFVNIAKNSFSGDLTMLPDSIAGFIGSDNQFSGEIPTTICELLDLRILDLSNNSFSGSLPRNFSTYLYVLHLRNNGLSGVFPEEFINVNLITLDVGGNQLSGKLPKSLINSTGLEYLNVEDNRISDTFPSWLSSLSDLQILVLRSNEFHGPILSSRGDSLGFPSLRIFDISENRFSGVLPSDYFAGWTAMSSVVDIDDTSTNLVSVAGGSLELYRNSIVLTNKGLKMELVGSVFKMYRTIDVSGNRFEGDIPESIGLLKELIVLNMSNNAFTGHIPLSLSNLSNLNSLDLSRNRLSGRIPTELGKLTFLAVMNFSYNRLEGPIPQTIQIQSQNSSSFADNPGLCGAPLQKKCGENEEEAIKQEKDEEKEEKDQVLSWIAAAIAYVPGVVCGLTIGHILAS